jgi:hypothetical protein
MSKHEAWPLAAWLSKRALPPLAVAGLLVVVACLILVSADRRRATTDTGETRASVEESINGVLDRHPERLDEPGFQQAARQALDRPYVAAIWLFAPDGRIAFAEGSTAASAPAGKGVELATDEAKRLASALPSDVLSDRQRTWLLAASTIQREGDHNDIYRHLVRPVRAGDGHEVGLLGVAYHASPTLAAPPNVGYLAALAAFLVGLAVYWLALPAWVLLDARARGERAAVWTAFVLVGNLVALMAYLLTRRPQGAEDGARRDGRFQEGGSPV